MTTWFPLIVLLASNWKRQAVQGTSSLFTDRRSHPDTSDEELKAELYQQIGQLHVELDWLKKSPAYRVRPEAEMEPQPGT